jgi:hypothetical protein
MLNNNNNDAVFGNSRAQITMLLTSIKHLRRFSYMINVRNASEAVRLQDY